MKATDSYLKTKDRVDLTAMIDVVFLLLIYFMVTTTIMKQEADLGIKLPTSVPAAPDTPLPEEHMVDILPDGGILFNGAPLGEPSGFQLPELVGLLTRIRASSERAGFKTLILINPDESTEQQAIVNVMNACVEAEVTSVTFASGE
jgi:biopolymer transport protein ExbD